MNLTSTYSFIAIYSDDNESFLTILAISFTPLPVICSRQLFKHREKFSTIINPAIASRRL